MTYLITKEMDEGINQSILSGDIEKLDKYLKIFSDNNLKDCKIGVEHISKLNEKDETPQFVDMEDFSEYLWCKASDIIDKYISIGTLLDGKGKSTADNFLNYVMDLHRDKKQESYEFYNIFIKSLISSGNSKNIEILNKVLDYNMVDFDDNKISYNFIGGLVDSRFLNIVEKVLNENNIDLNLDFGTEKETLLIRAAYTVNDKMIKLLIENGADINLKSRSSGKNAFSIILNRIPLEELDFIVGHIFGKEFIDDLKGDHDHYVSKFLLNDFDKNITKYSDDENEIRDVLFLLLEISSENKSNNCYRLLLNKIYDDHINYQSASKASINLTKIIRSAIRTKDFDNLNAILSKEIHNDEGINKDNIFFSVEVDYLKEGNFNNQVFLGLLNIAIENNKKESKYLDKFLGNIVMFGDSEHLNLALDTIKDKLDRYSPTHAMNRAVEVENHNALKILVQYPNVMLNKEDYYPLAGAANNDDLKSINILLDAGADPTHKPKNTDDKWILSFTTDKKINDVLEMKINKISIELEVKKDIKISQFYNNKIKKLKVKRIGGFKT